MKIHLIAGARPNFLKLAPLYKELKKFPDLFQIKIIHTGQHYDLKMSGLFFKQLELPAPDLNLEAGSASHTVQTAKIMLAYEQVLLADKPDIVVVFGDVNSTIACALTAVKMGVKIAHVEAGLRSYDRSMPEEINRMLTDTITDFYFTPSQDADENLQKEGVASKKIFLVGNIMIDSLSTYLQKAQATSILEDLQLVDQPYLLVTMHRPANVDNADKLKQLFGILNELAQKCKVIFPVHPRTRSKIAAAGLTQKHENLILTEPLGYLEFLHLQMKAKGVITDSGGIQEETTYLQIPCLTLRDNTERPITIHSGTNQLLPFNHALIVEKAEAILSGNGKKGKIPPLWDGNTAERIVEILKNLEIE